MAVGASGATEGNALVDPVELLAVASASRKVLLVSLLVGCEVVNVAKGCIVTSKVAGKVTCKIKAIVHTLLLPLQHTYSVLVPHPRTNKLMGTLDTFNEEMNDMLEGMIMHFCHGGLHQAFMNGSVVCK
jgi:hypothetical protein